MLGQNNASEPGRQTMSNQSPAKKSLPPIVFILVGLSLTGLCLGLPRFFPRPDPGQSQSERPATNAKIADVPNVPAGNFRYGGSTSWAVIRQDIDVGIHFSFPQFQLAYVSPEFGTASSEVGLKMLLDGKLDFVQSSKGIPAEIAESAKQRGIKLQEIAIAIDAVALAVHPSLNLPGLTMPQLEAIRSRQITNWRDVGGPDLVIQIYAKDGQTLTGAAFTAISTSTEAFRQVSRDPGGLTWGSATLTVRQCGIKTLPLGTAANDLIALYAQPEIPIADCSSQKHNQVNAKVIKQGNYPWIRRLSIVVIADGSDRQQAGLAYANMLLTTQGKTLLQEAGYLSE
jgi:phosphate transport system substrate-binding protein